MGEEGRLNLFLSEIPWPIELCCPTWPPYLCKNCGAMRFYYNLRMAQCFYCGHISLNWSQVSQGS